jgi:dienelactone hydrolase
MEQNTAFYSDGLKIACTVFEPEDVGEKSCPGLVLCQGMAGIKEFFWFPTIGRRLAEMGFVTVIWDFRGRGQSEGPEGRLNPLEQADDIRNALTFLETNPKVDPERLALFGWCWGGAMVPYVCGVDKRVKCAVSAVGFSDGEAWMQSVRRLWEWLELKDRIAEDRKSRTLQGDTFLLGPGEIIVGDPVSKKDREKFYAVIPHMSDYQGSRWSLYTAEKVTEFKPIEVVDRITCPMLYIGAAKDTVCPVEQTVDMYNRTKSQKKLWVVPGGSHYCVYGEPNLSQVLDMSFDWFREHLNMRYSRAAAPWAREEPVPEPAPSLR